jgi:hypothetical protein
MKPIKLFQRPIFKNQIIAQDAENILIQRLFENIQYLLWI